MPYKETICEDQVSQTGNNKNDGLFYISHTALHGSGETSLIFKIILKITCLFLCNLVLFY